MAGIFDTGIFDTGIFDHPVTSATITGTLAATEAQDTAVSAGSLAHVGTLAATDEPDTFAASGNTIFGFVAPPALFIVNMGRMMGR